MLAPGNPKAIRRLADLKRRGVRLINRQAGAGTRLFLFHRLRQARIDPARVEGYGDVVCTHAAVAHAIATGRADAGPGIRAAAQAHGLAFLPLGTERYDLVIRRELFESPQLRPLVDLVHGKSFQRAVAALPGYDTAHTSAIAAVSHGSR